MKTSKKILASLVALPLLLGSTASFAEGHKFHDRHQMRGLLKGIELTDEQKAQLKQNMEKLAGTPKTLDLKEKPNKEAMLKAVTEGLNLSQDQKNKIKANVDERRAKLQEKREQMMHVPVTLPELSEEYPVGQIPDVTERFRQTIMKQELHTLFKNVELTDTQKEKVRKNLTELAQKPRTMDLKERPTPEARIKEIFAGVELTNAQRDQIEQNFATSMQGRG